MKRIPRISTDLIDLAKGYNPQNPFIYDNYEGEEVIQFASKKEIDLSINRTHRDKLSLAIEYELWRCLCNKPIQPTTKLMAQTIINDTINLYMKVNNIPYMGVNKRIKCVIEIEKDTVIVNLEEDDDL